MQTLKEKLDAIFKYMVKFSNSLLDNDWYMLMALLLVIVLLGRMGMKN